MPTPMRTAGAAGLLRTGLLFCGHKASGKMVQKRAAARVLRQSRTARKLVIRGQRLKT